MWRVEKQSGERSTVSPLCFCFFALFLRSAKPSIKLIAAKKFINRRLQQILKSIARFFAQKKRGEWFYWILMTYMKINNT